MGPQGPMGPAGGGGAGPTIHYAKIASNGNLEVSSAGITTLRPTVGIYMVMVTFNYRNCAILVSPNKMGGTLATYDAGLAFGNNGISVLVTDLATGVLVDAGFSAAFICPPAA